MAAATLLRPGDVVGGFEVEDLIGIGGMATVYRAKQVSLGRPVALKVLSRQFTGDETFRERFRREGMHAASLEHPNIVPVYDSGEKDGLLYLAMRYVEGQSLAELLSTQGVTADQAIGIMQPIASALDCAHAAGLIHRDIKPQNILITNQGHPYLADFGVAKDANAPGLTATGGFVGSVNYASPEQIKGLTLTAASDIYALTAVLYHCLSGDVPYPGESEAGVMHSHLHEPPPTLPALEGADSEFHTVFARGMAKDPGARYGHAGDLLNAAAVCVSRMPSAKRKSIPAFPRHRSDKATDGSTAAGATGEETTGVFPKAPAFESLTAVDQRREPLPPEEPPKPPPKRRLRLPDRSKLPSRPKLPKPKLPSGARLPNVGSLLRRVRLPKLPSGPAAVRRRRIATAAVGGTIAAVALVALISSGGGGTPAKTVRKGPIELSYEEPWQLAGHTAGSSSHGLSFRAPIALRSDGATLVAGMLVNGAPVPGGIPPALASKLNGNPSKKTLHLGGAAAVRYAGTASGGGMVAMYVIPTDAGDIGVLCTEVASGASGDSCAKPAEALRVLGPNPVPAGADPALASALHATLQPIVAGRGHTSNLEVSQPAPRVKAARAIATVDSAAAKKLAGLKVEPRDRAAVAALAGALRREARALGTAAAAAKSRSYAKYDDAAKSAHAAGRAIATAAVALRRMAFRTVPKLRPLNLPSLPRPEPQVIETPATTTSTAAAPTVTPTPAPAPTPSKPEIVISKPE